MSANGNGHPHSPFIDVTPIKDEHPGLSCEDFSTGLRLNLRQMNGTGLSQILSGEFSGKVAEEQIREVLMGAMEQVHAIMQEHGYHAVRPPPGLEREM
ncbi:MAG: hypothetical protein KJ017_11720 [Alphaproteobacteria bacterium]|nr:hypothetical protein [Alphaproteobacteria bacterium]